MEVNSCYRVKALGPRLESQYNDKFLELKNKENKMTETHLKIKQFFEEYLTESEKFEVKGVKASAARARKALGELGKLSKARRAEIQDKKNGM